MEASTSSPQHHSFVLPALVDKMDKIRSCFCFGSSDAQGELSGPLKKLEERWQSKRLITIFEEKLQRKRSSIGHKTAVHFSDGGLLTYSQLNGFASCLAKSITERLGYDYKIKNPDNDMIIAVCLPISEKTIALLLGILKTGAAYLPLDPQFPENLLLEIIRTFKPVLLITDDNGKIFNKFDCDAFVNLCGNILSIEELWLDVDFAKEPKTRRASMEKAWDIDFLEKRDRNPELQPVVIFYSHGLGLKNTPVGVRVSTKSIVNLVVNTWDKLHINKKDQCCITVSIASPYSISQIFVPLLLGCTLHVFRRADVVDSDKFVKQMSWRNISNLSIPTHHLPDILDSIEFLGQTKTLQCLKIVVCRGAFIPYEGAKHFFTVFKSGVILANCVGAIETTSEIAFELYGSIKEFEAKMINGQAYVGTILENTKIYIMDSASKLVRDGSVGEVCITGDCLVLGYVGEGEAGGSNFVKNPISSSPLFDRVFKSGESGFIIKSKVDGRRHLMIEGRSDSIVKVRGHLFSTTEVNEFIKELEDVKEAYCFVVQDVQGSGKQEHICFVILKNGVVVDDTLQGDFDFTLRNRLPEWAVPDTIHVITKHNCSHPDGPCYGCLLRETKLSTMTLRSKATVIAN